MKRTVILTALLALVLTSVLAAQSTLRRTYRDLDVDVWTDRDDGSNYYEGDDITIYFRTSEDAYVTVYDLDTRGNVNLIFPPDPSDNHYVQGGEIYMIPESNADYTLSLEGPPGTEHIQMVASTEYFPVPDWRGPVSVYDDEWGFKYEGENEEFIGRVNERYFSGGEFAYDHVNFYVAPKYYYEPAHSDCSGDCGRVYIDYPDGCEVYVDGVFFGYAPLYVPGIYLGRHRVTVYWGTTVVYNDWIFVDVHDPFFIYTRPWFVYHYCWDRWYRNYAWDDYYYGPSRYKQKHTDFYSPAKPQTRRGYQVIANDHARYTKSNTYVDAKKTRITKYKEAYDYDVKTKKFTSGASSGSSETGKKYYNGSSYKGSQWQSGDKRISNDGTATKKGSTSRGYEVKKQPASGEKKGSGSDVRKPAKPSSGDTGKEPQAKPKSDDNSKSDAPADKKPSSSSGGKKSSSNSSSKAPTSGKKH